MKRWWQELNPVPQSQEALNGPVHKVIIQEAKLELTRIDNLAPTKLTPSAFLNIFEILGLNFIYQQSDDRIKLGTARREALMLPLCYIIPHLLFIS